MHSERRCPSRLGWFSRVAVALVLVGAAACGPSDSGETAEAPAPSTSVVVAEVDDAAPAPEVSAPATSVPEVSVPEVSAPEASVPTTSAPEASAPEASVPSTSAPATTVAEAEDTESVPEVSASATPGPEASVPTTSAPATTVPEVSVPTTSVPTTSVAPTSVPPTSVPTTSVPTTSVPTTSVPTTSVPTTSVPTTSVPTTSVPTTSVPTTSVPTTSVPSVSLPVAPERDSGYDRDDWGPHNSGLCRGAVGSPDPYTGTPIDTCNVDHVVALHEAHESGGWAWPANQKQQFSQDADNHVASRACVNQSKGGDDISEWSDADIASSSACGGGYTVTSAGRCLLARITVTVKSAWGLTVDQAEAEALSSTLAGCGDQAPQFSAGSQNTPTTTTPPPTTSPPATTAPTTTAAPPEECVIADKTAAQYDAVPGIGEVLSARLVDAQPFSSRAELEAVSGIGPARSEAVWSHFCGP